MSRYATTEDLQSDDGAIRELAQSNLEHWYYYHIRFFHEIVQDALSSNSQQALGYCFDLMGLPQELDLKQCITLYQLLKEDG